MPDIVEVYRAEYDTSQVQAAADAAARRVEALEREINELNSSFRSGGTGLSNYRAHLADLEDQLAQAQRTAAIAGPGLDAVGGHGRNLGFAFLEASRAIEDFSFAGLGGVVNNVPGVLAALGIGAGLTGVVSVAVVGIFQLQKHWDDLLDAFGVGIPQPALSTTEQLAHNIKALGDEMEKLQGKSRLTAAEFVRLQDLRSQIPQLKQQQADIAETTKLLETPSKATTEAASGFKEALSQVGGQRALESLTTALEKTANEAGQVANPFGGQGTAEEVARRLILEASRGDIFARGQITRAVGEESAFGQAITGATPESKAAAKEAEQQRRLIDELNKQGLENEAQGLQAQRKHNEEWDKQTDELNRIGEENQKAGEDVAKKQEEKARREGKELATTAAGAGAGAVQISRLLQDQGLDKETADAIAASAAQQTGLRSALGGRDQRRNVEVYGTADYLSRVQTAVGGAGDTGQRQLQEQIAMNQKLQALLENTKKFGLSGNDEGTFK